MSKKEWNIPAYFTSPNERGESQKAHTYCADKEIKPSSDIISSDIIYLKSDVYQHLSPMGRMAADFLIQQKQLIVIPGGIEGAAE